jgi:DNA-binding transcriptional LysR family regulator
LKTIDNITLRSLQLLQAVAASRSFSEAGRQLGMPRAVASQLVAQLEAQLDTKLFKRTTRQVVLTEAGEALIAQITRPLAEIQSSLSGTRAQNSQLAGVVRMSVSHALGRAAVLPALAALAAQHPEIQVDVVLADHLDDLIAQNLDFTIRMGELPDSSMVARKLCTLDVALVASPALLTAQDTPRKLDQLAGMPAIGFRVPGSGRLYAWQLRLAKASHDERHTITSQRIATICNSIEGVRDLALAGSGVAAIPRFVVLPDIASSQLVALMERYRLPTIPVFLYFTRRAQMPKRVRLVADALVESFKAQFG